MTLEETASSDNMSIAEVFGAEAAVCFLATIPQFSSLATVCKIGGLAAVGDDVMNMVNMSNAGQGFLSDWGTDASCVAAILGDISAFTTLGNSSSNTQYLAAGFFAAGAAAAYIDSTSAQGSANSECGTIQTLLGGDGVYTAPPKAPQAVTLAKNNSDGNSVNPGSNGALQNGSGGTGGSSGVSGTSGPIQSAASAGLMGKQFTNMGGNGLPDALSQIGTSLGAVGNAFASGQGLSGFMSGIDGLGTASQIVAGIEKDVKNGKIALASTALGGTYSGKGGGKTMVAKKDTTNPFEMNFGARAPATTAEKEIAFKGKAKEDLASDGDIWHSKWHGSIFELVSVKLTKSRDRIDALEWTSPLNRALAGLPNTPTKGK